MSATEFQTEEQESDPDGYDEAVIDPALREAFFGSIDFVGSVDQHLKSQHGFSEAQLAPHRYPTCNRCKESKSLTHCVNLKDRNELNTRRLACRDLQNAPSRAWTRFRSMSRSTSASPAPPAPSKRNVSAVQSPEHPARRGVQPTSPEPGMSRLLLLPQPAQTEPPALAGPPLRRRVASAPSSKMPKMHPQDTTCRRLLRNFMQRTASGIEFFRRDQRSQDTPDEAQARAEQTAISREHRSRRRAGEEPSPTPPLVQILEQHNHPVQSQPQSPAHFQSLSLSLSHSQPQSPAQSPALSRSQSQGTLGTAILSPIEAGDDDDDDFVCELCVNQRPNQARIHASTRREFLLTDGGQTIYYRACSRADGTDDVQSPVASSLPDSDTDVSSPGPIDNRRRRQGAAPPSSLSQSEAASEDILPDPAFNDQLNQPCLTVRDRKLIANWQEAMGTHVMQYCPQCKIKWFNLNM
ncbi:ATP-dependent DNA helicase PIF1 [Fusarium albosuccineum]|uniref:ATP-dependent DNA helicase PIF1 n=1 Tax=Fusarium albosuccineum TaxID=1237068 RepID=A0A8H4PDH9_9HYPO|nr:ATP-dependent DNA helicase PIF1 [Fusarium albosuccineum]